ncbi:hypothetical protein DF186_18665, partial [Enterococcus hirae]
MGAVAPAMDPPTATVGDPTELLDVDVDQLAGSVTHVADRLAGGPVEVRQSGAAVADQNLVGGRTGHAEIERQLVGTPPAPPASQ